MRILLSLLCGVLVLLSGGCAGSGANWVELDGKRWQVEVVRDETSRARGLMFRDQMPADHGMLFIHDAEAMQAYWMKNTKIALDILYFDATRRLVSQQRDVPPCSAGDGCPVYPSRVPVQYVLELNAGQAEAMELRNGTQLVLSPSIPPAP